MVTVDTAHAPYLEHVSVSAHRLQGDEPSGECSVIAQAILPAESALRQNGRALTVAAKYQGRRECVVSNKH
jgi:hypothetical protein